MTSDEVRYVHTAWPCPKCGRRNYRNVYESGTVEHRCSCGFEVEFDVNLDKCKSSRLRQKQNPLKRKRR